MSDPYWKEPEHKLNKLTERLFSEGYTREIFPDYVRTYNWFYGGFTYTNEHKSKMVFSTPCGLLVKGSYWNGDMSYMGIHWMEENDNPTICCPRFDLKDCELVHPALRDMFLKSASGDVRECACHLVNEPFDENRSLDKAHDDGWREANNLFEEFKALRKGRACKHRSMYNRSTKNWTMHYDPMDCAHEHIPCEYCDVLHRDISPQKANIYYDRKVTYTIKGDGLFPDETKVKIIKGKKMLDKPVSVTLCEAIIKVSINDFVERNRQSQQKLISIISGEKIELLNFHIERRDARDLKQDLADISEGIEVVHASDLVKDKAAKKKESKEIRADQKTRKREKQNIAKWKKTLGEDDGSVVMKSWAQRELNKRGISLEPEIEQINLFDDI